jgi:hypothetical protein
MDSVQGVRPFISEQFLDSQATLEQLYPHRLNQRPEQSIEKGH